MSYSSYVGAKTWYGGEDDFPQTLMMDDIAALQFMYGADFSYVDSGYEWTRTTEPSPSMTQKSSRAEHGRHLHDGWDSGDRIPTILATSRAALR